MAFVATLTGVGRNCTLTSGTNTIVLLSTTGLVVGATIQSEYANGSETFNQVWNDRTTLTYV